MLAGILWAADRRAVLGVGSVSKGKAVDKGVRRLYELLGGFRTRDYTGGWSC